MVNTFAAAKVQKKYDIRKLFGKKDNNETHFIHIWGVGNGFAYRL